jgi:hypothetical protein
MNLMRKRRWLLIGIFGLVLFTLACFAVLMGDGQFESDLAKLSSRYDLKPADRPFTYDYCDGYIIPVRYAIGGKIELHEDWQELDTALDDRLRRQGFKSDSEPIWPTRLAGAIYGSGRQWSKRNAEDEVIQTVLLSIEFGDGAILISVSSTQRSFGERLRDWFHRTPH